MKFAKVSAALLAATVYATSFGQANAFVAKPAPIAAQAADADVIQVGRRGRYIAGGLIAGAIIGGALARDRYRHRDRYYGHRYAPRRHYAPRRVYRRARNAHVDWCYSRYRSYRAYDNTYQPYHGGRRECYSPYY